MMHSDFWIYSDGSVQNMGGGEHAEIALKVMLKLPLETVISRRMLFSGLAAFTPEQILGALNRGMTQETHDYLAKPGSDPRYFAIRHWGWIRIAKSAMNVWAWDDMTVDLLRRSAYWSQQPDLIPEDMFDVEELSTGKKFSITVAKIMGSQDIGEAAAEPEVEKIYVGPRRGSHTDTGDREGWRYRRVGENPDIKLTRQTFMTQDANGVEFKATVHRSVDAFGSVVEQTYTAVGLGISAPTLAKLKALVAGKEES